MHSGEHRCWQMLGGWLGARFGLREYVGMARSRKQIEGCRVVFADAAWEVS